MSGENPQVILWPFIHTWSLAAAVLPATQQVDWKSACQQLGLVGGAFKERLEGLDQYLNSIDELLDELGAANGG